MQNTPFSDETGSVPTTMVAADSKPKDQKHNMAVNANAERNKEMMEAYIQGEETAATDYTTGWLKEFVDTATPAELQEFAERVCLNGNHDDFDSVFEGVIVPFTTEDDAENFRGGYMSAVWGHISDRIAMREDEAHFAAEAVTE